MNAIVAIDGTRGDRLPVKPAYGSPCDTGAAGAARPKPATWRSNTSPIIRPMVRAEALERDGKQFVCGMIRRPGHYMGLPNDWADEVMGGMIAEALGAGRGCDAEI